MIVQITDDFNLTKIIDSGQCFRAKSFGDGSFFFISGGYALTISRRSMDTYSVSCSEEQWELKWKDYFDLKRSYKELRSSLLGSSVYIDKVVEYGTGICILRQDPWEMIV